jgi:hypothetical protein
MPSRAIARRKTVVGAASGATAPIYVDSDDNILKFIPAGSGTTEVQIVDASSVQTLTNKTLTAPTLTAPVITGAASIAAGATITGAINGDVKVLAANQNFDNQVGNGTTLTNVTGMSWSVIAGATYHFKFRANLSHGTTGGLKMAFKLTTATLTSIALRTRLSTDTDNTGAVSTAFTTTTDQATWFDQKAVAYTNVTVEGTLVVNAAGTIAVQAAQNTADNEDSIILLGAFAQMERVL